MKFVYR